VFCPGFTSRVTRRLDVLQRAERPTANSSASRTTPALQVPGLLTVSFRDLHWVEWIIPFASSVPNFPSVSLPSFPPPFRSLLSAQLLGGVLSKRHLASPGLRQNSHVPVGIVEAGWRSAFSARTLGHVPGFHLRPLSQVHDRRLWPNRNKDSCISPRGLMTACPSQRWWTSTRW
jgi:hypothetical protein